MADLAGYTAMTDIHGGASAAKTVGQYLELVVKSLAGESRLEQRIGDQVVITAPNVADLSLTIRRLMEYCGRQHLFLSIHAGLHFGEIHIENGNLFGSTINVASRLMNLAGRGEVLCSAAFRDQHPEPHGFVFERRGLFRLKNVFQEVEVFELKDTHGEADPLYHDPVCHMIIDSAHSLYTYEFQGVLHHFCSIQCLDLFVGNPGMFQSDQKPDVAQ